MLFFFRIKFCIQRGLHIGIPDGTISDICENNRTFHPDQNQLFIGYIHQRCNESWYYPEDLVSVCFSVLHEFGHWEYFLACALTIEEYKNFDEPYREANRKLIASEEDKFRDDRKIPSKKAAAGIAFSLLIDFIKEILIRIKIG